MKYDEALGLWGGLRVAQANGLAVEKLDLSSVSVELDFNEGYSCCGGSDPNCYCSFAESPRANVEVRAKGLNGRLYFYSMGMESFDFATVLKELCELGEGTITSV